MDIILYGIGVILLLTGVYFIPWFHISIGWIIVKLFGKMDKKELEEHESKE